MYVGTKYYFYYQPPNKLRKKNYGQLQIYKNTYMEVWPIDSNQQPLLPCHYALDMLKLIYDKNLW